MSIPPNVKFILVLLLCDVRFSTEYIIFPVAINYLLIKIKSFFVYVKYYISSCHVLFKIVYFFRAQKIILAAINYLLIKSIPPNVKYISVFLHCEYIK